MAGSDRKRRIVTAFQRWVLNPVTKPMAGFLPGMVLLETKGRHSGKPRRTPVGGKLEGDTVVVVAEHGPKANYVRNIVAEPAVRVRVRGRWRSGTARIVDDPDAQRRALRNLNGLIVRMLGTDLTTIKIELG